MSTYNHGTITAGAAADAGTFNAPLGQLDAAIGNRAAIGIAGTPSLAAALGTATPTTTAQTVLGAINEIDADISAVSASLATVAGGATVSDARIKEWTEGGDYEVTSAAYDSDGVVTGGTVKWPDGAAGVYTTVTKDATWLAVNAYTITHATASKTVTQAAVTRDASGQVTAKPALTVA